MHTTNNVKDRTRFPLIRSLLFLLAVFFIWKIVPHKNSHTQGKAEQSAIRVAPQTPQPRIESYIVKPGDTFEKILGEFGITSAQAYAYCASLASEGLSKIFPGDSVVVQLNAANAFEGFSVLSRLTNWYHLTLDSGSVSTQKRTVPTIRYRCIAKGTLTSSLSEDLFKIGVGDALVAKIADIFAWDINFFMDPRKGDTFEILFEKLYREGRFVGYGKILAARYTNNGKTHHALAFEEAPGKTAYFDLNGKSVQKQFLKAPLRYNRISSGYTYRRKHPILGVVRPHLGIDYAAPRGTPVYASADGKVRFAGTKGGYGKFVHIAHGGAYETYYGHLHRYGKGIRSGVSVSQGQLIGTVGSTGLSTGPHLDYRMKRLGKFVNPLRVNLPSKNGVEKSKLAQFMATRHSRMALLDTRFNNHGYYVVDISIEKPKSKSTTSNTKVATAANVNSKGS